MVFIDKSWANTTGKTIYTFKNNWCKHILLDTSIYQRIKIAIQLASSNH
jgi:hypothetical protein